VFLLSDRKKCAKMRHCAPTLEDPRVAIRWLFAASFAGTGVEDEGHPRERSCKSQRIATRGSSKVGAQMAAFWRTFFDRLNKTPLSLPNLRSAI